MLGKSDLYLQRSKIETDQKTTRGYCTDSEWLLILIAKLGVAAGAQVNRRTIEGMAADLKVKNTKTKQNKTNEKM